MMPTLPLLRTLNSWLLVEEATANTARVGWLEVPSTTKVALGVEEPRPKEPSWLSTKKEAPEEEAICKGLTPLLPWRSKL